MKIIQRGENTWRLTWELGLDPATGNRRQRTEAFHGRKRDAGRRWREVQAEIEKGLSVNPPKITFGDLLDRWLQDVLPMRIRPTTLENYRFLIERHVRPALGHIPLARLTAADLQTFYRTKLEGGRRDRKDGGLSPRSVRYMHALIRSCLEQAVRWQMVPRNIADLVDPPRQAQREMNFWTPYQALQFLEAAKSDRLYPAFYLALATGLREGEILGLRWSDLDLDAGMLTVSQTLVRIGARIEFGEPKTARSRRTIDLGDQTVALLRAYRATQNREKLLLGQEYRDHGLVFPTVLGTPIQPRNILRVFDSLQKHANVPRIRFHDLRHSHASFLLAQGENPRLIAERLGHSAVAFTLQTYSHLLPGAQKAAARKLEEAISPPSGTKMGPKGQNR